MKLSVRFNSKVHKAVCGNDKSLQRQSEKLARWLGTRLQGEGLRIVNVSPGEYGCLSITIDAPFTVSVGCQHSGSVEGEWNCTLDGGPGFFENLFDPTDPSTVMCNLQSVFNTVLGDDAEVEAVEWGPEVPVACKFEPEGIEQEQEEQEEEEKE